MDFIGGISVYILNQWSFVPVLRTLNQKDFLVNCLSRGIRVVPLRSHW